MRFVFSVLMVSVLADILFLDGQTPNMFLTLQTLRLDYPTPMSRDLVSDLLDRAAKTGGWKLLRQETGDNCPTPAPSMHINCHVLVDSGRNAFSILHDVDLSAYPLITDRIALSPTAQLVDPW